jgi:hypothetical protein
MNKKQLEQFQQLSDNFKRYTKEISGKDPAVIPVYNNDLDLFDRSSDIRYIVVADNPGKEEAEENRYLVGLAGKQARNFFEHNELVEDFTKEVLVLNKTCLHTNSTSDLRKLHNNELLAESQKFMAELAYDFHKLLSCELWIVGCSEIKPRGIFSVFGNTLTEFYSREKGDALKEWVLCYKHFSYGNFVHELKKKHSDDIFNRLKSLGTEMRRKTFSW